MGEIAAKAKAQTPLLRIIQECEKLGRELLLIHKDREPTERRRKELQSLLIGMTEDRGGNYQVTVPTLGKISVSAGQPRRCEGPVPELVIEAFLALPEKERAKLVDRGIVAINEQWKEPYAGRVTPTLF